MIIFRDRVNSIYSVGNGIYHLRANGYERIERSELPGLADLDLELLKHCILIGEADLGQAERLFRQPRKFS